MVRVNAVVLRCVVVVGALGGWCALADCAAAQPVPPPPSPGAARAGQEPRQDRQRRAMVDEQLVARGIRDRRVLDAMRTVPRHRFVDDALQARAYEDTALPIGRGQTISQPYVVASMAEALRLEGGERVLEVGSGSGYAAAVLSLLAAEVYGIELEAELHERSARTLAQLGYTKIQLRHGDGFLGWPERAPFDAIVMSCAAEDVPQPLWDQLREGGRLVFPQGPAGGVQQLVLVTKARGARVVQRLDLVRFVPLRRAR